MGRPPLFGQPMSGAERIARYRAGITGKKRLKAPGGLKQPLPDCPLCEGSGSFWLNAYGPCDVKANAAPIRGQCACRRMKRRNNPTLYDDLRKMRDKMVAREERANENAAQCATQVTKPDDDVTKPDFIQAVLAYVSNLDTKLERARFKAALQQVVDDMDDADCPGRFAPGFAGNPQARHPGQRLRAALRSAARERKSASSPLCKR
jgi:hypothetical protein